MPTRTRKRGPTARTYESVERPEQVHFTPRTRTVTPRNLALSNPRTRQQTLTQIDFVSRYPLEQEDVDLNYLEDETTRARKRRKTMPQAQAAEKGETRATRGHARRRETTLEAAQEPLAAQLDVNAAHAAQPPADTALFSMPPPRTPQRVRKMEIPSSQSPADTPISARSRASARSNSRSPLKQRSTNLRVVRPIPPGTRKGIGPPAKLEVEDTYGHENEDSPRTSRDRIPTQQSLREYVAAGASFLQLQEPSTHFEDSSGEEEIRDPVKQEVRDSNSADVCYSSAAERKRIKSEVADSLDESEYLDDEGDFFVGNETQTALSACGVLSTQSGERTDPQAIGREEHNQHSPEINELEPDVTERTRIAADPDIRQEPFGGKTDYNGHSGSTPSRRSSHKSSGPGSQDTVPPKSSVPKGQPISRSESEEASAQLTSDLVRLTQPYPVAETESQFEAAWRDYSPPKGYDDEEHEPEDHELPHIPNGTASAELPTPIRPSQATTVDVTQSSPHITRTQNSPLNLRTQQFNLRSQLQPAETLRSSSPPPVAAFSSSPTRAVELVWSGERLTDSQLLPDSLMNDSLPAPPPLTQESLGDEYSGV